MEANIDWTLIILTFIVGCGVGALIYHLLNTNTGENSDLKQRMNQKEMEFVRLNENVSEHFARTDELLAGMEKNYQNLVSHLQSGAESFCDDASLYKRISKKSRQNDKQQNDYMKEDHHAPMDYAPKTSGTLSEDFGLEREEIPEPP
ncbi:YhcB family protein [Oceanospirillum linum]|uniref:Z-ring associated protein G n=1 Tax=Oceanospirillum linum TaxID=966 RepID=A0A1T1HF57_OCELI|nr:DUF1043 family protein [Oceanospirillum linum]OOV88445.1 hypothetical protein BTA35_0202750 [Oceanospirillum linum]SEF56632.1 hypothetical protein SAMN04489856_101562 [Oleiphilus messinensis]SMP05555.1 hypothetical protein SAMN06264348_101563 [Oceanospirillum linum]